MMRTMICLASVASAVCFSPSTLPPIAGRATRPAAQCSIPLTMHLEYRRSVLGSAALAVGSLLLGQASFAAPASAKLEPRLPTPDDLTMYVGAGCFWHVQHEMIVAEQKILGRGKSTFTAVAGYAGGTKVGQDNKVCYHNMMGDSDYGKMGHTEVVAVKVPNDRLLFFIEAFLNLFDSNGIRADPQDVGGEYRTALGLPGGIENDAVSVLKEFAEQKGMKVLPGKGNEQDTLKDRTIYVYDTAQFPFYAGELYHQYHNDMRENYGEGYRALRDVAEERGGALTFTEFLPIYEGTDIYGFPPGDRELLSRRKQLKPVITFD